jgi:hypothetical protein
MSFASIVSQQVDRAYIEASTIEASKNAFNPACLVYQQCITSTMAMSFLVASLPSCWNRPQTAVWWVRLTLDLFGVQRSALTDDDIRSEVAALQEQGHRRLLVLTGEHPKYTFDQFMHVRNQCVVDDHA